MNKLKPESICKILEIKKHFLELMKISLTLDDEDYKIIFNFFHESGVVFFNDIANFNSELTNLLNKQG